MRYAVEIQEHGTRAAQTLRTYRRVSLTQARGICERAARRGVARFGGVVERLNWGTNGGPSYYGRGKSDPVGVRSAVIRLDIAPGRPLSRLQQAERIMRKHGYAWTRERVAELRACADYTDSPQAWASFIAHLEYACARQLLTLPRA